MILFLRVVYNRNQETNRCSLRILFCARINYLMPTDSAFAAFEYCVLVYLGQTYTTLQGLNKNNTLSTRLIKYIVFYE